MQIGMLWYAATGYSVAEVGRAVAHYRQKHGKQPTAVFVSAETVKLAEPVSLKLADGSVLKLANDKDVIFNHFWIGFERG